MKESDSPLLISLKPCHAGKVFDGLKKAELRRRALKRFEGREAFVYVTSPDMELRGGFRVGKVWTGTPEEIWREVSPIAGIDKTAFDSYYAGCSVATALEIAEVWEYADPVSLRRLREAFPNFTVPQSWRYAKREERAHFATLERRAKAVVAECSDGDGG